MVRRVKPAACPLRLTLVALCLVAMASAHAPRAHAQTSAAAPGQVWWMCRYQDPKDPAKPALGSRMYYALFAADAAANGPNGIGSGFNAYVEHHYTVHTDVSGGKGFCARVSNDEATRTNSMNMFLKQWASSNIESINTNWTGTTALNP
jgi:hypothetical protein